MLPALKVRNLRPVSVLGAGLLLLVASACKEDAPTPFAPVAQVGPVKVQIGLSNSDLHPGDDFSVYVAAELPNDQTLSGFNVEFHGLIEEILPLPIPGPGSIGYEILFQTDNGPYEGTITAVARAYIGERVDTAGTTFRFSDDGPPRLQTAINRRPQPNDTMKIGFIARDVAGVLQMNYQVTGALTASGDKVYPYPAEVAEQFLKFVPGTAHLGDSVAIEITVLDGFNKVTTNTLKTIISDLVSPTMSFTVDSGQYDYYSNGLYLIRFAGKTLDFTASVSDNHKISWLGYRLIPLGLGDSILVNAASATRTWAIPVTAAMDGQDRSLWVFARDSMGNEVVHSNGVSFVNATRRAFQAIDAASPEEFLYSPRHGQVVLSSGGSVHTLSLDPFRVAGSVFLQTNTWGADIVPGRDTVWAGSASRTLNALDLSTGVPYKTGQWTATPLTGPFPYNVWRFRVTPDNRVLITGTFGSDDDPGKVVFLDLATGIQTNRTQAGFPKFLAASGDHTLILGYTGDGKVIAYRPATDVFEPAKTLHYGRPSVSGHGDLVLIHNQLYDGALNLIRTFGAAEYGNYTGTLSADGQYAHYGVWPGYRKLRTSDGVEVERVFVPRPSHNMIEIPERNALVILGPGTTALVDLSPGGVIP